MFTKEMEQMVFVEDDHVVEKLPSGRSDPALCEGILPGTTIGSPNGLRTHCLQGGHDLGREDRVPVEDEVLRSGIVGKSLPKLLDDPDGSRMSRDVEVKDATPGVLYSKPDVEWPEGHGEYDEEVHRCDDFAVVMQKRQPVLACLGMPVQTPDVDTPAAVEMSIFVVRAFVRLKEVLSVYRDLEDRVSRLEGSSSEQREAIETVIQLLEQLNIEDQRSSLPRIGFNPPTDESGET